MASAQAAISAIQGHYGPRESSHVSRRGAAAWLRLQDSWNAAMWRPEAFAGAMSTTRALIVGPYSTSATVNATMAASRTATSSRCGVIVSAQNSRNAAA
jgi:hypothetical protein